MTQKEIVLEELRKRPITNAEMCLKHNIFNSPSIICELRLEGYTIATELIPKKKSNGYYGIYSLIAEPEE